MTGLAQKDVGLSKLFSCFFDYDQIIRRSQVHTNISFSESCGSLLVIWTSFDWKINIKLRVVIGLRRFKQSNYLFYLNLESQNIVVDCGIAKLIKASTHSSLDSSWWTEVMPAKWCWWIEWRLQQIEMWQDSSEAL